VNEAFIQVDGSGNSITVAQDVPVGSMPGSPAVNSFVLHQMGNNNMVNVTQN
jgi:hypothetical protein